MLLPALAQAKQRARKLSCLSNFHQWGGYWNLYTMDFNGHFDTGTDPVSGGADRGEWFLILKDYWSKKPQVITCPAAVDPRFNSSGGTNAFGGITTTYQQIDGTPASVGLNLWAYGRRRTFKTVPKPIIGGPSTFPAAIIPPTFR